MLCARNGGTAKLSMVASSFGVAPLQHFGAIVEGPLDLRGVLSGDGAASMASELQSALDANGGLLVFRTSAILVQSSMWR